MHFANIAVLKFHKRNLPINIEMQQISLLTLRRDIEECEEFLKNEYVPTKKAAILSNNTSLQEFDSRNI